VIEKERTDEVLAVPEDDKQPQLVHPTLNSVLFCLAYKSAGFCSVNTITLSIRFVTANHRGISARNVPVLTVLLYIQYPLPWYSHKSCPRPRYYCGNFPEFFFRSCGFPAVISWLQLSTVFQKRLPFYSFNNSVKN